MTVGIRTDIILLFFILSIDAPLTFANAETDPEKGEKSFDGMMDEIKIWDRALTSEEISGTISTLKFALVTSG